MVAEPRHIDQKTVEAAIKALVATRLKTKSDSMLRTFLAFKAVHRDGVRDDVETPILKAVVEELFTLLPTPEGVPEDKFNGTIALRGSQDRPVWLRNDSYRGSFLDYAGPTSPGRVMFEDDDWRKPMRSNAVNIVAETLGGSRYSWPPRDALAVVALCNERLDPGMSWPQLMDLAKERFGLTDDEWEKVTAPRVIVGELFEGETWSPLRLAPELQPPGLEKAVESEQEMEELPEQLAAQVERVQAALSRYGARAIIALAGVPGTSKSHVARIAARAFASYGCMREIQFSPGYTYEEFMEGPRYGKDMEVLVLPGAFLELNQRAIQDPSHQYVLLIEELTRADLPRVLGELLTYIEYRDEQDEFTTMYRREQATRIAPNVAILATYNPTDRSAVNVDAALLRRMRTLDFPPSMELLEEILSENGLDQEVIAKLIAMFEGCREITGPDRFTETMPFGHAVFAGVRDEQDLHFLWHEEIRHMLVRPHAPRHELYDAIVGSYPWYRSPTVTVVGQSEQGADGTDEESEQ